MKNLSNIFDTIKQFVLGIVVAVLIPFIGHYTVILISSKPELIIKLILVS